MKNGRIHFFFPSTKVDSECQTPIVYNTTHKTDTIYDEIHKLAEESLIFQDPRPTNLIDLSYMQGFNSRLAYFLSNANDKRFDHLSPPPDLFHDLTVGLKVNLLDKSLTISGTDAKKVHHYPYENGIIPILESLESGIIGRELSAILNSIKANSWEDGRILCQITDFRFEKPLTYNRLLTVSYDIVNSPDFIQKTASSSQIIEAEKRILLLLHPQICTDPSPDVARATSIFDWRKKMWMQSGKIDPKASEAPKEQTLKPLETGNIELQRLEERVKIPDSIFQEFTRFTRGNSVTT
ncbi:hypothetical protein TRFO_28909 [Tritrichomonas foetus]|uniref:Spt20-like SEP domain-containing protein n=1 Tax=Tritrichomonas foetus TaxID=1144522 RepID=A0A1J4JY77_9EUKA|nr:hypothetical protein TRFO_28909 [Tritrichomonas foetus]|eukprot:OHT03650.1 hypothetical protein TRFO_28909 [Tritrichomonas foetus]